MATGQSIADLIGQLATAGTQGLIPPNTLYVRAESPFGVATVDPFAAAQDPTTQAILQRLGIRITLGFGPPPAPQPGEASLVQNLSVGLVLGVGVLALVLRPRISTAVVVGGAVLLLSSGVLGRLTGQPQPGA